MEFEKELVLVLLIGIVHSQIKASITISISLSNIGVPLNQQIHNIHVTSCWRQVKWRCLQSKEGLTKSTT